MKNYGNIKPDIHEQTYKHYQDQLNQRIESIWSWIYYYNPKTEIRNQLDSDAWSAIYDSYTSDHIIDPETGNFYTNQTIEKAFYWTDIQENLILPLTIIGDNVTYTVYIYNPRYLNYHQGITVMHNNSYGGFLTIEDLRLFNGTWEDDHWEMSQSNWDKLSSYVEILTDNLALGWDIQSDPNTPMHYWEQPLENGAVASAPTMHIDNVGSAIGGELGYDTQLNVGSSALTNAIDTPINWNYYNTQDTQSIPALVTINYHLIRIDLGTTIISSKRGATTNWADYLLYSVSYPSLYIFNKTNTSNQFYWSYLSNVTGAYSNSVSFITNWYNHRYSAPAYERIEWTADQWSWNITSFLYSPDGQLINPMLVSINDQQEIVTVWRNQQILQSEIVSHYDNFYEEVFVDSYHSSHISNLANNTYYQYNVSMNERLLDYGSQTISQLKLRTHLW